VIEPIYAAKTLTRRIKKLRLGDEVAEPVAALL